ncbi:MAG: substrate-binding domain-containing protein, partial [Candidatus Lokiarchaeota archaeon]|nr:substrate-binding domain-containing protein [Candidatus Lokiarchaeota archaeon]
EYDSNGAVKGAVSTTQYAIGYVGLGYVDLSLQVLEIDDGGGFVAPSEATVQDLSYPISRDLYMITMGTIDTQPEKVQAFFDFMLSRAGQYISKYEDFVPLPGYIL